MATKIFTDMLSWLECLMCFAALVVLVRAGQFRTYRYLSALLVTRLTSYLVLIPLMFYSKWLSLSPESAYTLYFYVYWGSYALEALFGFGIIISIYRLAMEPLKGLQSLGMLMFRWAGAISIAIALTIGLGPHVSTDSFIVRAVMQLQQTQGVLTLSMLLFVCFAIHPMGLSYRSRIFGVSLGLGLLATTDLVNNAWLSHVSTVYTSASNVSSMAFCLTLAVWSTYFALPEPKRRMIMLPTTSPFFQWNQISEVLGDSPGFVAVGAVSLDMFAPAELEVMRRASNKMDNAAVGF